MFAVKQESDRVIVYVDGPKFLFVYKSDGYASLTDTDAMKTVPVSSTELKNLVSTPCNQG